MQKESAHAKEDVGSAKAPSAVAQTSSVAAKSPLALVAAGSAEAPERGVAGCAAAPEVLGRAEVTDESKILDIPSLLAAFKKTDIGWTLSREQIIRAAEPKFRTPEMNVTLRKRSSLVGLLRDLVVYDPPRSFNPRV